MNQDPKTFIYGTRSCPTCVQAVEAIYQHIGLGLYSLRQLETAATQVNRHSCYPAHNVTDQGNGASLD